MKRFDLLKHYFTSVVIEEYIINTCRNHEFLPISEECDEYFHQEVLNIHDAYSFLRGSFPWFQNDTIDWCDVIDHVMVDIKKNGLSMGESIKPLRSMEPFKFIK
tara:strand:+ start:827 stop:1138 length:312 start_codon:yes stop_codon:yes gene_type:complete